MKLTTDYLVIGAGATAMAFVDTLLTDDPEAQVLMVDRHAAPGGHWNDAYPFVTLHQPSAFYGVNSLELSHGLTEDSGWNQGLADLATGAEVLAYYSQVMRHRFLPTSRVRYLPQHDCDETTGQVRSLLTGQTVSVEVRRKTVDCTYYQTKVPATHTRAFSVAEGVRCMAPGALMSLNAPPEGFTVVGGGKTGIDTCLWLLTQGVSADRIRWIMPRDAWLIDRRNTQATPEFFDTSIGAQAAQFEAIVAASSVDDLFDRLEAAGVLLRIDTTVRPTMFHAATVSQAELQALRSIRNVVRMGRVERIEGDRVVLQHGEMPTSAGQVHVDCTASAISNLAPKPIFTAGRITPQTVRAYQPTFSAALIAHVEATRETDTEKNRLCQVVPLPNHATDWIPMTLVNLMNQGQWAGDKELRTWILASRLDGFGAMVKAAAASDPQKAEVVARMRAAAMAAAGKLMGWVGQLRST
jgi:hypothetical protein